MLTAYFITNKPYDDLKYMYESLMRRNVDVFTISERYLPRFLSVNVKGEIHTRRLYFVKTTNQVPIGVKTFNVFSAAYNWIQGKDSIKSVKLNGNSIETLVVDESNNITLAEYIHTSDVIARWIPVIRRIEQNFKKGDIYTTVIWEDGSKPTVVKAAKGENPSMYFAVASAIAIKVYGSNSAFKREIKKLTDMSV